MRGFKVEKVSLKACWIKVYWAPIVVLSIAVIVFVAALLRHEVTSIIRYLIFMMCLVVAGICFRIFRISSAVIVELPSGKVYSRNIFGWATCGNVQEIQSISYRDRGIPNPAVVIDIGAESIILMSRPTAPIHNWASAIVDLALARGREVAMNVPAVCGTQKAPFPRCWALMGGPFQFMDSRIGTDGSGGGVEGDH